MRGGIFLMKVMTVLWNSHECQLNFDLLILRVNSEKIIAHLDSDINLGTISQAKQNDSF